MGRGHEPAGAHLSGSTFSRKRSLFYVSWRNEGYNSFRMGQAHIAEACCLRIPDRWSASQTHSFSSLRICLCQLEVSRVATTVPVTPSGLKSPIIFGSRPNTPSSLANSQFLSPCHLFLPRRTPSRLVPQTNTRGGWLDYLRNTDLPKVHNTTPTCDSTEDRPSPPTCQGGNPS